MLAAWLQRLSIGIHFMAIRSKLHPVCSYGRPRSSTCCKVWYVRHEMGSGLRSACEHGDDHRQDIISAGVLTVDVAVTRRQC